MKSPLLLAASGLAFALTAGGPCQAAFLGLGHKTPPPITSSAVTDEQIAVIQRALDEERYVDAAALLDQAAAAGAKDSRLTLMGGDLNLARGHNDEALSAFRSVEADPAYKARSLQGQGIALAELGRSAEAMAMLERAVAQDPNSWRAWNALGRQYDLRRDWPRAEEAYDHALSDSDADARVLNNRGYSLLLQKRTDEAVKDFVAALQKRPDLAQARTNLRLAMAFQGQYDRAVAGGTTSERPLLLNDVGYIALLKGDYPKAEELFTEAMAAKGAFYAKASANLELARNLAARAGARPTSQIPPVQASGSPPPNASHPSAKP